jgi:ADP-ribose pyrophosphatase
MSPAGILTPNRSRFNLGRIVVPDEPQLLLQTSRFRVVCHVRRTARHGLQAREIIEHPGAVTILPLLDDGRICLLRNYRLAVGRTLIELPAGTLEPGEEPAQAAERELAEETGYRASRFDHLVDFWMSPGILRERMHLFLATGLSSGASRHEPGEEIEPFLVTWDEALELADGGRIEDAKSLAGILYYDRFRKTPPLSKGG